MGMSTSQKAIIGVAILAIVLYFVTRPKAAPSLPPAPPQPAPPGPQSTIPTAAFLAAIQRYGTTPEACAGLGPTMTYKDGTTGRAMSLCPATLRPNGAKDPSVVADLQSLAADGFDIYADPGVLSSPLPQTVKIAAIAVGSNMAPPAGMQVMIYGVRGLGALPSP